MQFGAIDHIALNVRDVRRALVFYHEVLGLGVERLDEFDAGKVSFPSVRISPDTVVDLFPAGAELRQDGTHPLNHFCFTLSEGELGVLRDRLVEHEVEIVEEARPRWGASGWAPSMKVHDPDGNIVELKAPPGTAGEPRVR
jgi:catechol 2,3-dioxygenase-like lactoylglutathione lyase family enzyme